MTYNALDGGVSREDLIIEVLRDMSADVVVLQEVFDEALVRRLGDSLGMQYFFAKGNSKYHLAILSRWPISARHSHHPFPPIQQTVLEPPLTVRTAERWPYLACTPSHDRSCCWSCGACGK
jgi:hypothetical protein